jgi:type II secretory pathway component PulF
MIDTDLALRAIGLLILVLGLTLPVCLAWWVLMRVRRRHTEAGNRSVLLALAVVFCKILLAFTVLVALVFGLVAGLLPGIIVAIVLIAAVVRYRRSEMRYLIANLAEAAERGIPLETVAMAYAQEGSGSLAKRARNLADYLDAAMPLSLALSRSRLALSPEVQLAADVGEKTGTLPQSLKKTLSQSAEYERIQGAMVLRFFYLLWVLFMAIFVLTFVMLKIIPTFEMLFQDYGMRLPMATQLMIQISRVCAQFGFVLLPLLLLVCVFAAMATLAYMGLSMRGVPIVGRLYSTIDSTSVLRLLSVAVREKRPLVGNLELLAAYAPVSLSRSRLHRAIRQLTDGAHWCDALQHARLLTRAQAAVLKAAERAGNLAWALEEMADSAVRRTVLRAQAVLNVLFPGAILVFGLGVMFAAVSILLPLFDLINKLA